jgi:hypothetical protein
MRGLMLDLNAGKALLANKENRKFEEKMKWNNWVWD